MNSQELGNFIFLPREKKRERRRRWWSKALSSPQKHLFETRSKPSYLLRQFAMTADRLECMHSNHGTTYTYMYGCTYTHIQISMYTYPYIHIYADREGTWSFTCMGRLYEKSPGHMWKDRKYSPLPWSASPLSCTFQVYRGYIRYTLIHTAISTNIPAHVYRHIHSTKQPGEESWAPGWHSRKQEGSIDFDMCVQHAKGL